MIKAVVDPGVLISAAITPAGGPPARLVDLLISGEIEVEMVACPMLLAALEGVLARPKFARYTDDHLRGIFVAAIREAAIMVPDPDPIPSLTRDPDDDYIVALARAAGADVIVSGDLDLVELADPSPPVLMPRDFLERLGE